MNVRSFEIMQEEARLKEKYIELALQHTAIEQWAYVLHDKDVDDNGNKKRPHWHIICRLKYPQQTALYAHLFDVPEHFVNKIKGKWSDVCKYLIHENAPTKFQYSVEEVKTNFDFITEKNKSFNSRVGEIIHGITTGVIRDFNITDYVLDGEFVKYGMAIKRSFEYRRKLVLKDGGKNMDVIFITGEPGVGKTTYAKAMAGQLKYSCFVAGGSRDPFDGYAGQDCVILDDLRPDEHHISDLLKMTDNHTASLVSSRYFNKVINEIKLMIITSVRSVEDFYKAALFSEPELADQLCRRVFGYAKMTPSKILFSTYNQRTGRYDESFQIPNSVLEKYATSEEEQKKKLEFWKGVLVGVADGLKKISPHIEDYIEPELPASQQPPPRARGERKKPKKAPKRK